MSLQIRARHYRQCKPHFRLALQKSAVPLKLHLRNDFKTMRNMWGIMVMTLINNALIAFNCKIHF